MLVITGNRLLDGVVVFLAPANLWVEDLQQARCFEGGDQAEQVLDGERHGAVVDLAIIDVSRNEAGLLVPDKLRERIRAEGPTIEPFDGLDLRRKTTLSQ